MIIYVRLMIIDVYLAVSLVFILSMSGYWQNNHVSQNGHLFVSHIGYKETLGEVSRSEGFSSSAMCILAFRAGNVKGNGIELNLNKWNWSVWNRISVDN